MHNQQPPTAAKRTIKDSVFCDLFSYPEYVFQLYQALHPEDTEAREEDVNIVTIDRVVTDGMYNDLGFTLDDRLVVLVEAQSTWSTNIAMRSLLYLAETYKDYLITHELDIHGSTAVQLPPPELYVLYTGGQKVPNHLSLADASFGGASTFLNLGVTIITEGGDDIVGQYVNFARVCNAQFALHGRTTEAAREIIRICKESGYLVDYLTGREKEVEDIMFSLNDAEEIQRIHSKAVAKEAAEQGMQQGMQQGLQQGQELVAKLFAALFADGRAGDAERAASDPSFLAQLMEEYGLTASA